jgi:catechol 2,3-dioxygenase
VQVGEAHGIDGAVAAQADGDADVGRGRRARHAPVAALEDDAEDVLVVALDVGRDALAPHEQPMGRALRREQAGGGVGADRAQQRQEDGEDGQAAEEQDDEAGGERVAPEGRHHAGRLVRAWHRVRMSTSSQRPQGNVAPIARSPRPIDPGVTIGHVHLRTADIDRVRGFYVDLLGFDVVAEARDVPGWGTTGDILFVSAGGYHHHLGFNTWKSAGGGPQPDGVAGLHHVAIRYPTRAGLADALRRLQSVDWPLRQVTDHGTHEAIYISDPDGNDLELCWDRPFEQWPLDGDGRIEARFGDLDLEDLLKEPPPEG